MVDDCGPPNTEPKKRGKTAGTAMQTWQNKCLRRTCSHFSSMCARLNPQNACKKSKEIQSLYSALASVASLHHTHFCLQSSQRSHARLSLSIAKRMEQSVFTLTYSVVTVFLSQNKVVYLDIVVVCHHIVARVRSVSDSPISASLKRNRLARKFAYLQCPRLESRARCQACIRPSCAVS